MSPAAGRTGIGAVRSGESARTHAESGDRVTVTKSATATAATTLVAVVAARTRTITGHAPPAGSTDARATHVVAPGTVVTSTATTTSDAERALRTLCTAQHLLAIEMPLPLWTRVGPRNHVLDGDPDHPREGAILRARTLSTRQVAG